MDIKSETIATYSLIFHNLLVEVRQDHFTGHHGLFSREKFQDKQLITPFSAEHVFKKPSYLTLQISDRRHISLFPHFLQFVNHSCQPNCFFDTTKMQFISINKIEPGDELTFFYPSTEWKMAQGFACRCAKPGCLSLIQGASQMSKEVLAGYRLSDFIAKKIAHK